MHHFHGQGPVRPHRHGHPDPDPNTNAKVSVPQTEGRLMRQARLYDPLVWLLAMGQARKLRALPLDLVALKPAERVLDVGCGTGDLTLAAARRVGSAGTVFGIDASPEMIAVASQKSRRSGHGVQFRVEAVEEMSFEAGSFDVVLSSLMMHHLPGDLQRRALVEIRRVLRPGGRLIIMDLVAPSRSPRPWEPGWLILRSHGHGRPAQPGAEAHHGSTPLTTLMREVGFEGIEKGTARYSWIGYALGRVPA